MRQGSWWLEGRKNVAGARLSMLVCRLQEGSAIPAAIMGLPCSAAAAPAQAVWLKRAAGCRERVRIKTRTLKGEERLKTLL